MSIRGQAGAHFHSEMQNAAVAKPQLRTGRSARHSPHSGKLLRVTVTGHRLCDVLLLLSPLNTFIISFGNVIF